MGAEDRERIFQEFENRAVIKHLQCEYKIKGRDIKNLLCYKSSCYSIKISS